MLFADFVSVFALDVFGAGDPFGKTMLALAIHLIPTALVLLSLLIAWRWEWVGAALFTALGITHLPLKRGQLPTGDLLLIAGPGFALGALFLVGWIYRKAIRSPQAG